MFSCYGTDKGSVPLVCILNPKLDPNLPVETEVIQLYPDVQQIRLPRRLRFRTSTLS